MNMNNENVISFVDGLKRLSVASIIEYADRLGCSVDEILQLHKVIPIPPATPKKDQKEIENFELFSGAFEYVICILKKSPKNLTFAKVFETILQVYSHSQKHSFPEVDYKFADWLIDEKFSYY